MNCKESNELGLTHVATSLSGKIWRQGKRHRDGYF
jgi:hypothetical protein